MSFMVDQKEGAPEYNAPLGTERCIAVETASSEVKPILCLFLWRRCCCPVRAGSSTIYIQVSRRCTGNFARVPRLEFDFGVAFLLD